MVVEVLERASRRRYEVYADDVPAGFLTYRLSGTRLSLIHTEVETPYEGNGLESVLVRRVLEDAHSRGLSVVACCPYVSGWLDSHDDYVGYASIA